MLEIFTQLSLLLLVVLGVSFIARILRQPLIIGYIFAGILVGPFFLNILQGNEIVYAFSEIGIAFLLFIVGLHMSPRVIKEVGKISLITGAGQVIFTSLIGYFIAVLLGFPPITAIYIALALTFSSTIIIMKLLADKEDLEKLYGKISIGFLLVQDLIAIILLIVISSFSLGNTANLLTEMILKGGLMILILVPVSLYLLPKMTNFFAKSQEFLFLFAIAWGLGLAALFLYIGLSIEVGALIAGIILSMSPYSYEISSRLKPLRDFFIISFFLLLGSQMIIGSITNLLFPAIIFSLFILIGNPLIVMILMGLWGYSKKTGFQAGLTVAQISEFSLILIALGVKLGQLSPEILSFVTMIGLITIAGSTYLIMYSDKIYPYISRYLSIFEKKNIREKKSTEKDYEYFLFGENRIGFSIMKSFIKSKKNYVIVDFNPERVKKLCSGKVQCVYGDVSDSEFLDSLGINKAKLVVSTMPEKDVSFMLLNKLKDKDAVIIVTARHASEVFELYKLGADYVIMPHFLGGEYVSRLIENLGTNKKKYIQERNKHLNSLKERIKDGDEFLRYG